MKTTRITASDLFCGAGGFSTGLLGACSDLNKTAELLAVNHWPRAIEVHDQPAECAAAMGLDNYQFTGTKADQMKMIGNAVSVECARALCRAVLQ